MCSDRSIRRSFLLVVQRKKADSSYRPLFCTTSAPTMPLLQKGQAHHAQNLRLPWSTHRSFGRGQKINFLCNGLTHGQGAVCPLARKIACFEPQKRGKTQKQPERLPPTSLKSYSKTHRGIIKRFPAETGFSTFIPARAGRGAARRTKD